MTHRAIMSGCFSETQVDGGYWQIGDCFSWGQEFTLHADNGDVIQLEDDNFVLHQIGLDAFEASFEEI